MRYRQLSPTGDSTFGSGDTNFLVNSPATVAQAILTKLGLLQGEWFLDDTIGYPFIQEVEGFNTQSTRDAVTRNVVLNTEGVMNIDSYSSDLNTITREFTVMMIVDTVYGQTVELMTTL